MALNVFYILKTSINPDVSPAKSEQLLDGFQYTQINAFFQGAL